MDNKEYKLESIPEYDETQIASAIRALKNLISVLEDEIESLKNDSYHERMCAYNRSFMLLTFVSQLNDLMKLNYSAGVSACRLREIEPNESLETYFEGSLHPIFKDHNPPKEKVEKESEINKKLREKLMESLETEKKATND